jgi:hypothetical protein
LILAPLLVACLVWSTFLELTVRLLLFVREEWSLMTKHSKFEKDRRAAETIRTKEIEAAWFGSVPKATAQAFELAVAAARARPPQGPWPNMPPGTRPNPPKHEPRPSKEEMNRRSRA